jgi:hypothetical protein
VHCKHPKVVNSVYWLFSSCRFAFDCDDDGSSCSKIKAKWNLSSSQSNEYIIILIHEQERSKQVVMSSLCIGTKYLVMEMNFCVDIFFSLQWIWSVHCTILPTRVLVLKVPTIIHELVDMNKVLHYTKTLLFLRWQHIHVSREHRYMAAILNQSRDSASMKK